MIRASRVHVELCQDDYEYHAMIGPLVNRDNNRPLGTIQIYSRCDDMLETKSGKSTSNVFSNDDEVVFGHLLEVISSAFSSLQNQQVILMINELNERLLLSWQ